MKSERRLIWIVMALLLLLMSSCPGPYDGGSQPPIYSENMLGEWVRMDTGERWYISGNEIKVDGAAMNRTVALSKTSDQVITVKESGKADYFLFASRVANASFRAQVVFIGDNNNAGHNVSRDLIGGNGQRPPVKITNPQQPSLPPIIVTPDPDTGEIIVNGVIPGDPVIVVPDDAEWGNVEVELTPWADGQDLGIIPLARGANLKATIRLADSNMDITELYADGQPRDYIIEVENIGTAECTGADYALSWNSADFDLISGSVNAMLDTIAPGAKKQIPLTLVSKPITNRSKAKEIKVTISSYDTVTHGIVRWEDTVSINCYQVPITFRFSSQKPIQGIIQTPQNKTYYFRTAGTTGDCSYSINLPWSSENYMVTFLGASVENNSETGYSLAIDAVPPTNWDFLLDPYERNRYEPANDYAATATYLNVGQSATFMGYLHNNDVDYYRINLGATPPANTGIYYSVSFNSNGGNTIYTQTISSGDTANRPVNPAKSGYSFAGWYSDSGLSTAYNFNTPVLANITLYAKWNIGGSDLGNTVTVPSGSLVQQLNWIASNAVNNGNYLIEVNANESIGYQELTYNDKSVTITLKGIGSARTISLLEKGEMFVVGYDVTLILDNNITLQGRSDNFISLISVTSTGSLIMNGGAKIIGNTSSGNSGGGGVGVFGGTFTMNGGEISGNTSTTSSSYGGGGGVYLSYGVFTMSGGKITGNSAVSDGGGVYMQGGTFTMEGGEISGNITSSNGGGVYVNSGNFIMSGGKITDNTSSYEGGGVYMSSGTFVMEGGEIFGNTASGGGGGGVFNSQGTFTMEGGEISGNTSFFGSGVYVSGTFTMESGKITGNTAPYGGGGVYMGSGTFVMEGGEISGNTATDQYASGGGVLVSQGTFVMSGGKITGNTVSDSGGGVYMNSGTFVMEGGEIYGNTASSSGGGVNVYSGTFTMSNGEIYGNTATSSGGGVNVGIGTFRINNGTIYGSGEDEGLKKNTAGSGAALYNEGGSAESGTFSGTDWNNMGSLSTTDDTIRVINGVLESGPVALVTFNSNGGSIVSTQTVSSGSTATRPVNPTRGGGYTFDNWYSDSGLTTEYDFSTPVTRNITLYAKWVVRHTVSFNSNSGTSVPSQSVDSGETVTRPADPVRSGYSFAGWYSNSGLTMAYNFSSAVLGNITLYAKWNEVTPGSFNVRFESNGGSSVATQTVTSGSTTTRPANPTLTGYTFVNWYSNSELTTVYNFSTPVTENKTLYAKWNINQYTVTFNSNGGSGTVPPITVNYGSSITLPDGSGLSKSGNRFDGWNINSAGSGIPYAAGSSYTVSSNVSLYAKWTDTTVYLTFNDVTANGSASATTTKLTLTFSAAISGLTANDINISGVAGLVKGTLSGSGSTYTIPVSGFTSSGNVSVSVSKTGYNISGNSKTVQVYRYNYSADGMVRINAGTFTMGDNDSEVDIRDFSAPHQVTLSSGFYMGKYPITQAQYESVMGSLPGSPINYYYYGRGDNYPVYYVSWYDALVFCNKLSVAEGLSPAYSINGSTDTAAWGAVPSSDNNYNNSAAWDAVQIVSGSRGYRLPTEAQWEYACRAGTTTWYNWGTNTINSTQANYSFNTALGSASEVGRYPANAWGLYDMHGNVLEWCWDWYGKYPSGSQTNPMGPSSGNLADTSLLNGPMRVLRGGSYSSSGSLLSSFWRRGNYADEGDKDYGFRVVRPE